jgi:hypothetical protein
VPRLSAIPIELSHEYRDTFVAERHSSLQGHLGMLNDLRERLRQMQVRGMGAIRGPEIRPEAAGQPAISLDLDDLYLADEPVELRAELVNSQTDPEGIIALVEPVETAGSARRYHFVESPEGWTLRLHDLPAGLYRVEVETQRADPGVLAAVHDVFEVVR